MDINELKFLKVKIEKHPVSGIQLEYLDKQNAIAALLLNEKGDKALLVKQYRPGYKGELLEIPAGLMEANEDPKFTMEREIREETGYIPENYKIIYSSDSPLILSPGCSSESLYTYVIQLKDDSIKPKTLKLDEGEVLEDHWIKLNEIKNKTCDFKTIYMVSLYHLIKYDRDLAF